MALIPKDSDLQRVGPEISRTPPAHLLPWQRDLVALIEQAFPSAASRVLWRDDPRRVCTVAVWSLQQHPAVDLSATLQSNAIILTLAAKYPKGENNLTKSILREAFVEPEGKNYSNFIGWLSLAAEHINQFLDPRTMPRVQGDWVRFPDFELWALVPHDRQGVLLWTPNGPKGINHAAPSPFDCDRSSAADSE